MQHLQVKSRPHGCCWVKAELYIDALTNNGATPLTEAWKAGHETMVILLVENGAGLDAQNHNGTTVLMNAVKCD
jgi:ankyrin repeat protein